MTLPRLTPREAEVVALVLQGLTSRQIARRLYLSVRTVDNHVQRVLHRWEVPNRPALVSAILADQLDEVRADRERLLTRLGDQRAS